MSFSMWSRLSLRWQVAIAVLLPCSALPLASSLYFSSRLNQQAQESLETRVQALGMLAAAGIGPVLQHVDEKTASPVELDELLRGVEMGGDVEYLGVIGADGRTVWANKPLPPETFRMKQEEVTKGRCAFESGALLVIRCPVQGGERKGMFVAAFRRDSLLQEQRENLLLGLSALGGALLFGLFLAFVFSRALAEPVVQVTQAAREVAGGDVTVSEIKLTAAREIRSMASSFNEMLANLRNLVTQMVNLTERLSGASQGLLAASQDQEHVTSQQATYAQEIAATFEELSRSAEQIAASTDVVERAARRTNEAVEEAKAVVAQVTSGIADIRTEAKEVAEAILKLNEDLREVSKIAQVINAVAERSDLLALNAALEGTKAGEVGRGFSLVAAEMRKLAENVSGSARDIGRIIETIQESGNQAVAKARLGVATADRGVKVADQAAALFQRMVELARGTTEAAQQITTATHQQRQSSDQAVEGARNVADLVNQGVDATGRTNKIAKDLQTVAEALTDLTGKFRVVRD